jgi:hypothetical protein
MLVGVDRPLGIVAGLQLLLVAVDQPLRAGAGLLGLAFGHGDLPGSVSSAVQAISKLKLDQRFGHDSRPLSPPSRSRQLAWRLSRKLPR